MSELGTGFDVPEHPRSTGTTFRNLGSRPLLRQDGRMPRALLLDAARTPFARYRGGLAGIRVDDLATLPIAELLRRHTDGDSSRLDPRRIDDIVLGNTNGAGEDNRDVARMAALLAGVADEVPGSTVNRMCASGAESFVQAARAVRSGEAELVVAGGVEGMSRAPFVLPRPERALPDQLEAVSTALGWRMVNPRMLPEWTVPMGRAAEDTALELDIGRTEMDNFTLRSHRRAAAAWDAGVHDGFAFPVSTPDGALVRHDESVRTDTSAKKLGQLASAFTADGPVTAGNAAPMADGAVAALIGSQDHADRLGVEPLGELLGSCTVASEPQRFTLAPVSAVRRLLGRLGVGIEDVDLWEINESFAAAVLSVLRKLPEVEPDRVNVHGGALAYGHPLGASMARTVVDLCRHLGHRGGGIGVATTGVGVGQGVAVGVRV